MSRNAHIPRHRPTLLRQTFAQCLFMLLILIWLPLSFAQMSNNSNVGLPPNGAFSGDDFESVQLNNGNLHIEIPIWSAPGRGPSVSFKYLYDAKQWYFDTHCTPRGYCTDSVKGTPMLGLSVPWAYSLSYKSRWTICESNSTIGYWETSNYTLAKPDHTKVYFEPSRLAPPGTGCSVVSETRTLYATDGSGWRLELNSGYAASKDGTRIYLSYDPTNSCSGSPGKAVQDSNGNQIILQCAYSTTATDTLGRTINGDGSYFDSSGALRTIQVTTTPVTFQTALCGWSGGDACGEYSGTRNVPAVITLPNGLTYSFTYAQNSYGQPLSVTLPAGGQISWTWGTPTDGAGPNVVTRTMSASGVTGTWTYNYVLSASPQTGTLLTVTVTDPQANDTKVTCKFFSNSWNIGPCHVIRREYYAGSSTSSANLLQTVATDYTLIGSFYAALPIRDTTTWNQTNQVTKTETDWDTFTFQDAFSTRTTSWSNPIQRREYAYGIGAPGPLVRKKIFNYLHLTNATYRTLNIGDRITSQIVYDGAGAIKAQTTIAYDGSALLPAGGAPNHDYTNFGTSNFVRGNPTVIQRWLNASGTWLPTTNVHDELGNLRSATDPLNHLTTYSYADDWANTYCIPAGANTQAFVTQVMNHLGHRMQKRYFPCTGLVQRSRDENDILAARNGTTYAYDFMTRLVETNSADGGQIANSFNDAIPFRKTTTQKIDATTSLVTEVNLDGLGRPSIAKLVSDPQGAVYTRTSYDPLGRKATEWNPTRCNLDVDPPPASCAGENTFGTTQFQYDALSRVTKVIPPDGTTTSNNVTTSYSGSCTTVTDQVGKIRKSCTDALGRLIQVFEPNSSGSLVNETAYQYDTLDNLTRIDQKGNTTDTTKWRTRTFTYDSLSRLATALNPEISTPAGQNCTVSYTYDNDGDLLSKTGPAPNQTTCTTTVTINYAYDELHRKKQKSYTDGTTATVKYGYDGIAPAGCTLPALTVSNGSGKRTGMCDAAGAEAWSYEITAGIGWKTTDVRTTNGVTKTTIYQNNLAGSVFQLTYPSGRTITYGYSAAGRPLSARDLAYAINYAIGTCGPSSDGACYSPQGTIAFLKNGTNLSSTFIYNSRLQPCWTYATTGIALPWNGTLCNDAAATATILDFKYDFALGVANNGNVSKITNRRDSGRSITYTYDELNRIKSAVTDATSGQNCWGQLFGSMSGSTFVSGYDIWANLSTVTPDPSRPGCGVNTLGLTINNLNKIVDPGFGYDAAGNLTADPGPPTMSSTYDAENRLKQSVAGGVTTNYVYDGDGRRAWKANTSQPYKLYWYGAGNDPLGETDGSGVIIDEYIFFATRRIARRNVSSGNIFYYFADHLGTSRSIVQSGQTSPCFEADFYPFGGERPPVTNTCPQSYKFTGYERDGAETTLDYARFRYYSSGRARFNNPDPVPGSEANPQSHNRYAYVFNNPLQFTDPKGLYPQDQHEFITFLLAVLAGRSDAQEMATGAAKADDFYNATTGLLGLGAVVNFSKHFGVPSNDLTNVFGERAGFAAHLIEDNGTASDGTRGPHQIIPGYNLGARIGSAILHIPGTLFGFDPDRSRNASGGFRAVWESLRTGREYPKQLVETLRQFVNEHHLNIVGLEVGGESRGASTEGAILIQRFIVNGYILQIWYIPSKREIGPIDNICYYQQHQWSQK